MKTYKKPVVTVDAGMAEGIYAASGAKGTLNVVYHGVWDRWGTNGGKGLAMADWSDINGTITLNITFNDSIDQVETDNASVQASCSGKTATFTFASTVSNSLTIGVHLNHGTSIDDLKMTGFTYSVKIDFKTFVSFHEFPRHLVSHISYPVSHKPCYRYSEP